MNYYFIPRVPDDEKEELKREIADALGLPKENIRVFGEAEFYDYLREIVLGDGTPEWVEKYVDYDRMIDDMIDNYELIVYESEKRKYKVYVHI